MPVKLVSKKQKRKDIIYKTTFIPHDSDTIIKILIFIIHRGHLIYFVQGLTIDQYSIKNLAILPDLLFPNPGFFF
jgi:hypothetical protein